MSEDFANEEIEQKDIDLTVSTLTGDIRDFLLDRVRNHRKPWIALSEDEQRGEIASASAAAENLVYKAVHIIASLGRKTVVAGLEQMTVKDGIKVVLKCVNTAEVLANLGDSVGSTVLIVVADAEPFIGERQSAEPMPDQLDLIDAANHLKENNSKIKPIK